MPRDRAPYRSPARRPQKSRRSLAATLLVAGAAVAVLILAIILMTNGGEPRTPPQPATPPPTEAPRVATPALPEPDPEERAKEDALRKAREEERAKAERAAKAAAEAQKLKDEVEDDLPRAARALGHAEKTLADLEDSARQVVTATAPWQRAKDAIEWAKGALDACRSALEEGDAKTAHAEWQNLKEKTKEATRLLGTVGVTVRKEARELRQAAHDRVVEWNKEIVDHNADLVELSRLRNSVLLSLDLANDETKAKARALMDQCDAKAKKASEQLAEAKLLAQQGGPSTISVDALDTLKKARATVAEAKKLIEQAKKTLSGG